MIPAYFRFGKRCYSVMQLPDVEWRFSYSATELEKELNRVFSGQVLKEIYVSLEGYLESLGSTTDYIDMSCLGGTSLLVFDSTVLQLAIHAEGMIEYRRFPTYQMSSQLVFDYPPEDMAVTGKYFFNVLGHAVSVDYTGKKAIGISVKRTDAFPFSLAGFDEAKGEEAEKKNDLPSEIDFHTGTCSIRFIGADTEYYVVRFETVEGNKALSAKDILCNCIQAAVDNNDYSAAKFLLDHGADPNLISDQYDCPFWNLQYIDEDQNIKTRIDIAKLFLDHGADPNLKCDGETLYDYVLFKIFNEMSDPNWEYLLEFYKLLIAYGGGGFSCPKPVLSEPIDKTRVNEYDICFFPCADGYHLEGYIFDPDGKDIGKV